MTNDSRTSRNSLFHFIMIFLAIIFFFPLIWSIITSLKIPSEVIAYPPEFFPDPFSSFQYRKILSYQNGVFFQCMMNTAVMVILSLTIMILVAYPAAYAFVFFPFKGSKVFFILILAIMMVPFQSLVIPLYQLLIKLKLFDTKQGLSFIYLTYSIPFCVFMLRNAISGIPRAIRESALIDGASDLRILVEMYFPLTLPALSTCVVFLFMAVWNDFLLSMLFASSTRARNIQVMLNYLSSTKFTQDWGVINAGAVISMIPVIIIFILLQKHYVAGMTTGSIK